MDVLDKSMFADIVIDDANDALEISLKESLKGIERHYGGKTVEERAKFALASSYNSLKFCISHHYQTNLDFFADEITTLELIVNGVGYTRAQILRRLYDGYEGYKC